MPLKQTQQEALATLIHTLWSEARSQEDLLVTFKQQIRHSLDPRPGTVLRAFCDRSHTRAILARGMPDLTRLEERLIWFPHGILDGIRIGILSSRIGRRHDRRKDWFAALRQLGWKVKACEAQLVVGSKSAPEKYACHLARRTALPLFLLHESTSLSLAAWLKSILFRAPAFEPTASVPAFLSPPLTSRSDSHLVLDRDLAVASVCDELYIPHVRSGGRVERVLRATMQLDAPPRVFVRTDRGVLGDNEGGELLRHGALPWDLEPVTRSVVTTAARGRARFLTAPVSREWLYLTHCTRERSEPWPGQSEAEYLDALIGPEVASYSALASLTRILEQSRILASTRTSQGGTPVVSFTALPLSRLQELHAYRAHRVRWDFQPYVICIHTRWIQERGGNPVTYGSAAERKKLGLSARAFFQVRYSGSRNEMDWSHEQEWRVRGDLDLRQLPSHAGLVFVPGVQEAQQVAPHSRWPIVIVPPQRKPDRTQEPLQG